jgi:hypothetical protein
MSDLASGRYPDSYEEWVQDGMPVPPDRHGLVKASGAGSGGLTLATTILYAYPFVAQVGDVYRFVRFIVKTIATATSAHAWVAVYNGTATGAALLGQTADTTAGWTAGLVSLALTPNPADIGTIGTPQGGSTAAIVPDAPAVWGLVFYDVTSGAGNILDAAAAAGSLAGEQLRSGQAPLCTQSAALTSTATAPAVLPTMTATAAAYPLFSLTAS